MSLTSQLNDKNSPIRHFFAEFEEKDGMKSCLALLQSTAPMRPLSFMPSSPSVASVIGTTVDCLLRYTAGGNKLHLEGTITHSLLESYKKSYKKMQHEYAVLSGPSPPLKLTSDSLAAFAAILSSQRHLEDLYEIGKRYLDGRDATNHKAVYSATAMILVDCKALHNKLPKLFSRDEKTTSLFDEYFANLGGEQYAQDISDLIQLFVRANKDPKSELFGAKMVRPIWGLGTFLLQHGIGAEIDCFIEHEGRLILTDIKTLTRPLTTINLRQIISYALLYDEEENNYKFTDIGIYHARSGSFRFLPLDSVIKTALPSLKSVKRARKAVNAFLTSETIVAGRRGLVMGNQGRVKFGEIVAREQVLRDEIAKIVAEIEAGE